jgi:hypothetical protein
MTGSSVSMRIEPDLSKYYRGGDCSRSSRWSIIERALNTKSPDGHGASGRPAKSPDQSNARARLNPANAQFSALYSAQLFHAIFTVHDRGNQRIS